MTFCLCITSCVLPKKQKKLDNQKKWVSYNPPKFNGKENLNRLVMRKDVKFIINPPKVKHRPCGFTGDYYQTFEELTLILLEFFQKTGRGGILPNSIYEASFTMIPKSIDTTRKENYRPISPINLDVKIKKGKTSKLNSTVLPV